MFQDSHLWQVRLSASRAEADGTLIEGSIEGAGVWVGRRWILTCAHVVGSESARPLVRFSFAEGPAIPAVVVPGGWIPAAEGDLALLELANMPPPGARPAPLRCAVGVSGHPAGAYGYPRGYDGGVRSSPSIEGYVAAPGGAGEWLQLTAQVAHGHAIEKGFSGSGLWDDVVASVVGLVAVRDKAPGVSGGFAIPMRLVSEAFPQLRPWLRWRLSTDSSLRAHWRPRARGVYRDSTPGWYFTGRRAVLKELVGWIRRDGVGSRLRVVTGPAGTGKSAVLAWLAALSDPELRDEIATARRSVFDEPDCVLAEGAIALAVWARDMTVDGAATALAAGLPLSVPGPAATVTDVLAAAGELSPAERAALTIVVDALDEAAEARQIARQLLGPLSRDLGVRVLVGTRPGRDDALLRALAGAEVIHLDDPRYFDREDLVQYAAASLGLSVAGRPSVYACDADVTLKIAEAIADAAGSNFLVAGMAARARATEAAIDTSAAGWAALSGFPSEVGEAFDDYMDRFGDDVDRARDLLRALAYAEGDGLPATALWTDVAKALAGPRAYGPEDLAWLLDSAAAYLVDDGSDGLDGAEVRYRLFHQALVDHLRPAEKEQLAQRRLVAALEALTHGSDGQDRWSQAPSYVLEHLAAHARRAGSLDRLVRDPGFLLAAEPAGLSRALLTVRQRDAVLIANAYREAEPELRELIDRGERAAYLLMAARKVGASTLADALAASGSDLPWSAGWAAWRRASPHRTLARHLGWFTTVRAARSDGIPVAIASGSDGTIRAWDLTEARPITPPIQAHTGRVLGLATIEMGEECLAVSVGEDGLLGVQPVTGDLTAGPWSAPLGAASAVVAACMVEGRATAFVGDENGHLQVWDLQNRRRLENVAAHSGRVTALATGLLRGRPAAVSAGEGGELLLWADLAAPMVPRNLPQFGGTVSCLALPVRDGAPLAVLGTKSGSVCEYDLRAGTVTTVATEAHDGHVTAVALGGTAEQELAVSAGRDGHLRVWTISPLAALGAPLIGHANRVTGVALTTVAGDAVAVTSGGSLRLWNLRDAGKTESEPVPNEVLRVTALAATREGDRSVVVAAGEGGTLSVRQFSTGSAVRGSWASDVVKVSALTTGRIESDVVVATGGGDGAVRVWRLADRQLLGDPLRAHLGRVNAVALGLLDAVPVVVSCGDDGAMHVWDLAAGRLLLSRTGRFATLALATLAGRQVAVTGGSRDGSLRCWDLIAGRPTDVPGRGPRSPVTSLCITAIDDDLMALCGTGRGGLQLRSLTQARPPTQLTPGHDKAVTATACGTVHGRPVGVSVARDGWLRVWDLSTAAPLTAIRLGSSASSVTMDGPDVVVGTKQGLLHARLRG